MDMGKKKTICLYVDEDVVQEAKELGLNLSKTFENALKDMIARIKGTAHSDCPKNAKKAGLGGIEPPTPGLKAQCSA